MENCLWTWNKARSREAVPAVSREMAVAWSRVSAGVKKQMELAYVLLTPLRPGNAGTPHCFWGKVSPLFAHQATNGLALQVSHVASLGAWERTRQIAKQRFECLQLWGRGGSWNR